MLVRGPRAGPRARPDDRLSSQADAVVHPQDFAFEAREYLRVLLVGKEVKFSISHTVQTTTPPLEFGVVFAQTANGVVDVGLEVVKAGWAKLREGGNKSDDEESGRKQLLKEAEAEAMAAGKGVWGTPVQRSVEQGMPDDPTAFLQKYKGTALDGTSPTRSDELAAEALTCSCALQRSSRPHRTAAPSVLGSCCPPPSTRSSLSASPACALPAQATAPAAKGSRARSLATR